MFLGLILISLSGANNLSIALTSSLVVVEYVRIEDNAISKRNLHMEAMPLCISSLENKRYMIRIKVKKNRKGLRFRIRFFMLIRDKKSKRMIKMIIKANGTAGRNRMMLKPISSIIFVLASNLWMNVSLY